MASSHLSWPGLHLLRSLPLKPTHVLGSPTLCFFPCSYYGPTPRNLMQEKDRQLKSWPSPPVSPLAKTLSWRSSLEGEKHKGKGRRMEGQGARLRLVSQTQRMEGQF